MRIVNFRPQNKNVTGTVEVKLPSYRAMMGAMIERGFESNSKGTFVAKSENNFEVARQLAELAALHVGKLDLKRKDGLCTYESFEDLEYDRDGIEIINEIATFLTSGQRLGKS